MSDMKAQTSIDKLAALDRRDILASKRAEFSIPEGLIYLDGNSLGVLPRSVKQRLTKTLETEWGESLIRAWNTHDWMNLPGRVGEKIAALIGAQSGSVTAVDTTSLNVAKAVSAGLNLNPERKVILTDNGNFPTDIYMAQGVADTLGRGHQVKIVDPENVFEALDETIAVMMITQVDYRTGRRHDMQCLTARAHEVGAIAMWDLAHSAGAFKVELDACDVDLAVGCTYKYLNGGPGSPAFIYVAPRHQKHIKPMLSGWIGHQAPFEFDLEYQPADGVQRMNVGTPPVLALSVLDEALNVWSEVDLDELRDKSVALCELFIKEAEARCERFGLRLASPRNAAERGSQVSFHCPQGYAVMRALIDKNVIGDFRAPDVIRFGFTPLYVSYQDVYRAAEVLQQVMEQELWNTPEFMKKEQVT